jgi:hypothetical protein
MYPSGLCERRPGPFLPWGSSPCRDLAEAMHPLSYFVCGLQGHWGSLNWQWIHNVNRLKSHHHCRPYHLETQDKIVKSCVCVCVCVSVACKEVKSVMIWFRLIQTCFTLVDCLLSAQRKCLETALFSLNPISHYRIA